MRRVSRPYPYAYGFIIGTCAADGDSVDCYIITKDPLKTGTIVECEQIGLLEQYENGEADHKVLATLPGQHVEINQELLNVFCDFIYGVFTQFPKTRVSVGRILPVQAAINHIQQFQEIKEKQHQTICCLS